ncbi:hypothetical protein [Chryseobacterium lathyri]|jgi:hypothetical protein|uniref:Uncharacterized protein n=1 Tax=Chryseobacterium lathyri TaxID=395933 RepID=A0A511YGB6_9FLAO|nr:hypothetical protein [Chryseobacterium lathyri]GEN74250.1 hypothetical protein CLA01_43220 [Chryseobacterium lathyri]
MELKQLNKIGILLALVSSISIFSQMKMADIEDKDFSVNSKTEKRNLIKIFDDRNYSVYYILDRRDFDLKKGLGTNGIAKVIFFSKNYNKGILVNFKQMIYHAKTNIYDISLHTGSYDKYMFKPSMIVVDKDFNYEYLMMYHYMPPPPPENGAYKSWITIQDNKNRCNVKHIDLKGNAIYENIDDILNNISKIGKDKKAQDCEPVVYEMDLRDYFPKKIIK